MARGRRQILDDVGSRAEFDGEPVMLRQEGARPRVARQMEGEADPVAGEAQMIGEAGERLGDAEREGDAAAPDERAQRVEIIAIARIGNDRLRLVKALRPEEREIKLARSGWI